MGNLVFREAKPHELSDLAGLQKNSARTLQRPLFYKHYPIRLIIFKKAWHSYTQGGSWGWPRRSKWEAWNSGCVLVQQKISEGRLGFAHCIYTFNTGHPTFPKPSCLNCTVLQFITTGREGSSMCSKSQPLVNSCYARPFRSCRELLVQLWRTGLFDLTQNDL